MVSKQFMAGLGICLVSVVWAGSTIAADVRDWLGLFPEQPCQDGWSGCVVGGFAVDAGAGHDSRGLPQPADLRLGWFDLQPTPVYSPFAELSSFTGALPDIAPSVVELDEPESPEIDNDGMVDADNDGLGPAGVSPEAVSGANQGGGASASEMGMGARSDDRNSMATERSSALNWGERASEEAAPNWGTRDDAVVDASPPPIEPTAKIVQPEVAPPPPPEVVVETCDDVTAMEPAALMGRLRDGQLECIEDRMFTASQVDKDKLSRLLLKNSEAGGDKREWERLVRRHLEEIDRSDPNLCFKYAVQLAKGGVSKSHRVIKWSEYALENKSRWSGSTFKKRVTDLYKLRAQASSRLWEQSNRDLINAAANRDDLKARESKARGQAKTFSKEWLDYARASGQDTRAAMAMCVSAAGSREFCE